MAQRNDIEGGCGEAQTQAEGGSGEVRGGGGRASHDVVEEVEHHVVTTASFNPIVPSSDLVFMVFMLAPSLILLAPT